VRGVSIICHGASGANAIKNAVRVAMQAVTARLSEHLRLELAHRNAAASA
jgi:fatty acid/phospholipid biosynthesis enzyme